MSETARAEVIDFQAPTASPRRSAAFPFADVIDYRSPFTNWLERYRLLFFAILAILIIVPFNGEWRLGLDSSLYRGVAENLVAGKGYTFAGLPQRQIYPGFPALLVVINKLTGTNSVVPVLVLMNVMALLAMWGTYLLIKTRYPIWIAVVVTCGVAMNAKFVQQAHEVMTDMPFLLGCIVAMLGWEWLGQKQTRRELILSAALLVVGLFLAAMMRPTFWVLALALVITCVWNIIRRREKRSMIAMAILGAVFLAAVLLDPRYHGINPFQGSYEKELVSLTADFASRVYKSAPNLFNREVTETFFNEPLSYLGLPLALTIMLGAALVTRRQPLWGLQIFILTGVMLVLSDVPRYYLMVLPTMWLGYVLVLLHCLRLVPRPIPDLRLFFMFTFGNALNLAGVAALVYEQHSGNFLESYRHGSYIRYIEMARIIRERVPPDAVVVGPYANVMTYLSGRNVLSGKLMDLDVHGVTKYPSLVARHNPTYLVGPHTDYTEKDKPVARLITRGVIRPVKLIDRYIDRPGSKTEHTIWLATAEVVVPTGDWRKLPTTRPIALSDRAERVAAKQRFTPEELAKRELKAKRERKRVIAEREARKERNARKIRRAQRAATQPAGTQPTTQPLKQPGKPPASIPTTRPAGATMQPTSFDIHNWHVPLADLGTIEWAKHD